MKTVYLECNMGAAGDMLMAALYELLSEEQKKQFLETMNGLGLPGVEVAPVAAKTGGITGTHMRVTVHGQEEHDHHHEHEHHEHSHHHHHATPGHIGELIDSLSLPQEVREKARQVYDAIAQVEALAPNQICASPVHVGSGTVHCAHGIMPVPAPATANLLRGVPTYGGTVQGELCTPTGAALLKTFVQSFGPMGTMEVEKIGYGVGSKEFEQANCVRAFWGESQEAANGEIVELVCNIDDMTPEALAFACSRLLEAGALDVYTIPGTMKKGRPGHVLTVLCEPEREGELARQILAQTTTNGLRARRCGKYFLTPGAGRVQTQWGPVGVKLARGYGVTHAKPEFEDAAALARAHGLPYRTVFEEAMKNWEENK